MRRLKKKTRFTTYYYKYTTEKNPKLRAVEGNKTFGINFLSLDFIYFFLRNCDHFYLMNGDDALIMREMKRKKLS